MLSWPSLAVNCATDISTRSMDLSMLTWFGSRERTVDDWEKIFKAASPNFQLRHAKPAGMNYNIDVEWTG